MKLSPRDLAAHLRNPPGDSAGLLIYGDDAMRVTLKRQDYLKTWLGAAAEEEMRLTRLSAAELRSDPAALLDAVKAVGFFPGSRAVLVEGATDGMAPIFKEALAAWTPGDAQIVVTAGRLAARSALRKLFEGAKTAFAAAIYDEPPSRAEIEQLLAAARIETLDRATMGDLEVLARSLSPGDFRQTIEKLGLYKWNDPTPVTAQDIEAVAPQTREAELDDILHATAEADTGSIGPILTRLSGQGVQPVALCIAALRHFRTLHAAASHPGGPQAGLSSIRPPVFGPRRDRMQRQAQRWGIPRLEQGLSLLIETDLTLRSAAPAPDMAVMERALIRLAMMPAHWKGKP